MELRKREINVGILLQKSNEIEQITEFINEIAGRTNLLALNASIEAAKAGTEGRGFAVVAGEIKKLAEQTNISSENIKQLIVEVQKQVSIIVGDMTDNDQAVQLMSEAVVDMKQSMEGIQESTITIKDQMEGIDSSAKRLSEENHEVLDSTKNIAAVIEELTASITEVSSTSQQQNAMMQQLIAMSDSLREVAEGLDGTMGKLKSS
ncbi:methyl-accepting chemotaxis protein [Paenibacillus senegalensis]|uniref:methyl-accepting chemotaxis protein n=1 Tax=Paenibacillus senegalensis TaxID=1465766 RepID=UPI0002892FFA|nr:methyl-accepting chemotaxis protein [Paenibacillus senegalensis]